MIISNTADQRQKSYPLSGNESEKTVLKKYLTIFLVSAIIACAGTIIFDPSVSMDIENWPLLVYEMTR